MNNRIYGLIGLCMKAGKVLSGNEQVEKGIRKGKGYLLILAADSSEQTKKDYVLAAERHHLPYRVFGTKEMLGQALGKGVRTAVLITDRGFARAMLTKLE